MTSADRPPKPADLDQKPADRPVTAGWEPNRPRRYPQPTWIQPPPLCPAPTCPACGAPDVPLFAGALCDACTLSLLAATGSPPTRRARRLASRLGIRLAVVVLRVARRIKVY